MLETLRNASKGWLAAVLILMLVGSFGIWGVQDMLNLTTTPSLAKVGDRQITPDQFQREFARFLMQMQRESNSQLTTQQAKALNFDREALDRMLTRLALIERAKEAGYSISQAQLLDAIRSIRGMSDPQGNINFGALRQILDNAQLSQDEFLEIIRGDMLREQLIRTMLGGIAMPAGLEAALNRFRLERRVVEYVKIDPSQAGEIKDPDDATLKKFYETHAAQRYSVPEYRTVTIVQARTADVASQITVTEEEIKRVYDASKRNYEVPDKRVLEQIRFKTEADAVAGKAKLDSGTSFEELAKTQGYKPEDIKLGEVSKTDTTLPADAFAIALNTASKPLKGPFGWVIVRALSETKGSLKTLDEVRGEIRERFVNERARDKLFELTNDFEDTRGAGSTLEEAATKHKLFLSKVTIDSAGNDATGKPVENLPGGEFLARAFAAETGIDSELTEGADGSYYDFRVDNIKPATKKPFEQVRADILTDWRAAELDKRIRAIADDLVKKAKAGKSLTIVAAPLDLAPIKSEPFPRYGQNKEFGPETVAAAHEAKIGDVFTGPVADGKSVIVAQLASVEYAPEPADSQERRMYAGQLREAFAGDLAQMLATSAREETGVTIDEQAFQKFHTGE
jgi:peptidyl-prolyl cis-trans isomerase D